MKPIIIPAIDLIDGKCVRLKQGDYAQKTEYHADPLVVAQSYEAIGVQRLHLVDLDGAKQKKIVNHAILEKIASKTRLKVDFGGGIRTEKDAQKVFDYGASQLTVGSLAVKKPEIFQGWITKFGAEKLILGADVRAEKITVAGWLETTEVSVFEFIENYVQQGIRHVLCTDVSRDGMMTGTAEELYQQILVQIPDTKLIASGGVKDTSDLERLTKIGVNAIIIGKALYENTISLQELKRFL